MSTVSPLSAEPPKTAASKWRTYLEMVRFSHTIFAMPFAVLAVLWCMAIGFAEAGWQSPAFSAWRWGAIVICMITARNFAMTVNRIADRKQDAANPRTAMRHIPAGLLSVRDASLFAIANAAIFVLACLCFLPNWLPIILCVPVLVFLAGYSFAKRFTAAVHFYLGLSLMLAPICTWIALRGEILLANPLDILPAVLVGLTVMFWVSGFDLIYACQDEAFDRSAGLHSIPARIGVANALRLASLLHALMFVPMIALPFVCPALNLGWIYAAGVVLIFLTLVYEHSIVSATDLSRVNAAFFQANAIVGCLFLVTGALDAWIA